MYSKLLLILFLFFFYFFFAFQAARVRMIELFNFFDQSADYIDPGLLTAGVTQAAVSRARPCLLTPLLHVFLLLRLSSISSSISFSSS